MKTPRSRIAGAIADHTLTSGSFKAYAEQVAALLLNEKRVGELDSLLRDVQAQWAKQGYVEVLAHAAHVLDASSKKAIATEVSKAYPTAKQIVVTEVLDPDIIGGVQIRLADTQLDLSVEAKLNRFKQLTAGNRHE